MPTRNINLTERYDQFVEEQIESGRYGNASEVLRAGLQLLERQNRAQEQKLAILRKLATEAFAQIDQGKGIVIHDESELSDFIAQIGLQSTERTDLSDEM